jgi:hypothetical protein
VLGPLAQWLGPDVDIDRDDRDVLAAHDARLTEDRAVLAAAEQLVDATASRHRESASGPAAAVELDLLAGRLSPVADEDRALLQRAALLCAEERWDRLATLLPGLRNRVARASEELAEVAVRASRLERSPAPTLAVVPTAPELAFAAESAALDDELRRHMTRAGAHSAYAAADGTFLPSLAEFLA